MRYLFGGILSLLLVACHGTPFGVCSGAFETNEVQVVKSTTRLASQSRDATVEIHSHRPSGSAFGTGTAFKYKRQTIVVTAAHVIGDTGNIITVSTYAEEVVAKIVYYDRATDLAVLSIPDLSSVKPMRMRPLKQNSLRIGHDILYSGYPNVTGLFTIEGYVAGLHARGDLYVHSYAWPGASGSAVLDLHGRLVGVLVALDVGEGLFGMPNIIEDVVVVIPIWKLNFELLDLNLGI